MPNFQCMIFAKSGHGKGIFSENIIEELHRLGFLIIIAADPKLENELSYAQFPPIDYLHLDMLRKVGKRPGKHDVKIYHPFTFSIPKKYLPEINFYTIPLKSLGREEFSLLSESDWDSETIKLLINASMNIGPNDGLYTYLHYIQSLVKGTKEKKHTKPDWRNFGLESTAGTPKSVSDISNFFQPFKHDFFLASETCQYNLNWKEILADQKNYHIFNYKWIKDEKIQEFTILHLIQEIIRNKDLAKHPICIVFPEIRKLTPYYAQGYKAFLSKFIRDALSTCRSMGKGISTICDSQSWSDVSEEVKNSATVTLFGELSPGDAERVSKAMNYKRDIRTQLTKMEYGKNTFFIAGKEDTGTITGFFPSHMHCEESYNFEEMFHKFYPEKEKRYINLINEMQKVYDDEESKVKALVKKKMKEIELEKEEEAAIKESKSLKTKKIDELSEKTDRLKEEKRQEKIKRVVAYWKVNPEASWNKIGKDCEVDPKMAKKYFLEWEEEQKKKIGEEVKPDVQKFETKHEESVQENKTEEIEETLGFQDKIIKPREKIDPLRKQLDYYKQNGYETIELPEDKAKEIKDNEPIIDKQFIGEGILPEELGIISEETEEDKIKKDIDEFNEKMKRR